MYVCMCVCVYMGQRPMSLYMKMMTNVCMYVCVCMYMYIVCVRV